MSIEVLPTRGRGPFMQYLWSDADERTFGWLGRGWLIRIERDPRLRSWWCVNARSGRLTAALLRLRHVHARRVGWTLIGWAYRVGLWEGPGTTTMWDHWWRGISPFPWRGGYRERSS